MTDLALLVGPTLGLLTHEAIDAIKTRPRIRPAIRESYRAWISCMVGRAAGLAHAVGASIPASSGGGLSVSATYAGEGGYGQAHHRSGDARSCSGCRVGCGERVRWGRRTAFSCIS